MSELKDAAAVNQVVRIFLEEYDYLFENVEKEYSSLSVARIKKKESGLSLGAFDDTTTTTTTSAAGSEQQESATDDFTSPAFTLPAVSATAAAAAAGRRSVRGGASSLLATHVALYDYEARYVCALSDVEACPFSTIADHFEIICSFPSHFCFLIMGLLIAPVPAERTTKRAWRPATNSPYSRHTATIGRVPASCAHKPRVWFRSHTFSP